MEYMNKKEATEFMRQHRHKIGNLYYGGYNCVYTEFTRDMTEYYFMINDERHYFIKKYLQESPWTKASDVTFSADIARKAASEISGFKAEIERLVMNRAKAGHLSASYNLTAFKALHVKEQLVDWLISIGFTANIFIVSSVGDAFNASCDNEVIEIGW